MKKEDSSPAISLFSFQDIITSITGIMFLVVLLLILLLFESKPIESEVPEKSESETKELAEQIAAVEKMISAYLEQEEQLKKQLEEYQKMPPEMIEQRKRELERTLTELQHKIKRLKEVKLREDNLEKQYLAQQSELKQQKEESAAELIEEQKKVTEAETKLKKTREQLDVARQTVKFSVERETDSNPLLAEFSADGFRVLDVGTQNTFDLRKKGAAAGQHIQLLKNWLKQRNRMTETLSVVISPSCLEHWDELDKMLKGLRFPHGLEIYPQDGMSIFDGGAK